MLSNIDELEKELENISPQERLQKAYDSIEGEKIISLSMQLEGLVLLDMLLKKNLAFTSYTLDTGRLHDETYRLIDTVRFKYKIPIKVYYPNNQQLEKMVSQKGMFSFKESVANRKECCSIRKIHPNERALKGKSLWITGLRRDQSAERSQTKILEFHESKKLYKISPLATWSWNQVYKYALDNHVPIHPLYKQGYKSIGCAPCTRTVSPEEDERAGRWWWESGTKECGLHIEQRN